MFRKIAIALVAASVFTAPVLAQTTPSDSKASPSEPAATDTVKAKKTITKHSMVVRHHRHGAKTAKYAKYGKYSRHVKHGGTASKQITRARASAKPISSKPKTKSGID